MLRLRMKNYRFGSKEYRDELRHIVDRLNRNTGKSKPMSVWTIDKFVENNISYNKRLL